MGMSRDQPLPSLLADLHQLKSAVSALKSRQLELK
jgi:hypothetical protein